MNNTFYDCSIHAFEHLSSHGDLYLSYNGDERPIRTTSDYTALTGEPLLAVIRLLLSVTSNTSSHKVYEGDVSAYWVRRKNDI